MPLSSEDDLIIQRRNWSQMLTEKPWMSAAVMGNPENEHVD
jgi:hypothetical protein